MPASGNQLHKIFRIPVFDYVVVTDIANYYDGISFDRLRNVISGYGKFGECLLDFLFYMLEAFVWRPDYLPLSGIGLPQVNFDAPRILAHSLLFEVDKYLKNQTGNNFVRWMDDIDFGVNDTDKAKQILGELDELLLTRGLHLNLGKTKILSGEEAKDYFLPDENRYLSVLGKRINKRLANGRNVVHELKLIRKRFRKFLNRPRVGRWDKVFNRYISIATVAKDRFLEKFVPDLLENSPTSREHIFRYYTKLGPSKTRYEHLRQFYLSNHCSDDTSIFKTAKVFVDWHITPGAQLRNDLVNLAKETAGQSLTYLLSSIWIIAKYGTNNQLASMLGTHSERWKYSAFLARQVAAVTPRLRELKAQYRFIEKTLADTGQLDALRVMYHLNELRMSQPLNRAEKSYIMHGSYEVKTYPLSKFLITCDLLKCTDIPVNERRNLRDELLTRIPDPLYIKELKGISF